MADPLNTAAPTPGPNMGAPVPRLDARLKVTGQARYAADLPVANPAHAFLVTSAIAKGRIERLDLEAARVIPGVLDILTADNTGELTPAKFEESTTSIQNSRPRNPASRADHRGGDRRHV